MAEEKDEENKKKKKEEENKEDNNSNEKPSEDKKENNKDTSTSKNEKMKKELKNRYYVYIGIFVVVLLGVFFILNGSIGNNEETTSKEIVAEVNGEKITRQQLDSYKTALGEQNEQPLDDASAVENLVNQKLLYEEAKKTMDLSDEEVESILEQQLTSQGMSLEDLKSQLEGTGEDYDAIIKDFKEQIVLSQYYEKVVSSKVNVTEEEINQTYKMLEQQRAGMPENQTQEMLSKEELSKELKQQKERQEFQKIIGDLREDADIEIKEENLEQTQEQTQQMEIPMEDMA